MKLGLITLAVLLCSSSGWAYEQDDVAKTITSDGSAADTQAAITYVKGKAEDGWVLTIGTAGGSYDWLLASGEVLVDVLHNFTIKGASPTNRPSVTAYGGFVVAYTAGKVITVKDFIFPATARDATFFVRGSGPSPGFRFTNCKFFATNGSVFKIGESNNPAGVNKGPYGLFDNIECEGNNVFAFIYENYATEPVRGLSGWRQPMEFGTEQSIYIEDSYFHSDTYTPGAGITDNFVGGGFVFRHNISENRMVSNHGADHNANRVAGGRKQEIMHNTFTLTADATVNANWLVYLRGGTGVVFDNTFEVTGAGSSMQQAIFWDYYRASSYAGPPNSLFDRWYNALNTTIAAGSNGQSLPQTTIHVASTAGMHGEDHTGPDTYIEGIQIVTSDGVQTVNATGKTATTFTGVTGGTGVMTTGGAVTRASDYGTTSTQQPGSGSIFSRVAAGSDGASLPHGTINVDDTSQFPASGTLLVNYSQATGTGTEVTYTGKTATTFTGCTGGTGTIATGQLIGGIGQDPRYPEEPWGRMPVWQWHNRNIGGTISSITSISGYVQEFVAEERDIFIRDSQTTRPTATGTWLDSYTEYTYPHPLRAGEAGSATATTINAGTVTIGN